MRNFRGHRICTVALAALAIPASLHAEAVDTIIMADTTKSVRTGHVVGVDATQIRLEVPLERGGPGARLTVSVPRSEIDRIEFAENESLNQLLADHDQGDIHEIGALWQRWRHVVDLAKSPAARIGNVYGLLLLETGDEARAETALEIFTTIETSAWDDSDRQIARQGRLRAMVATGSAADAVAEAEQLAVESEDSRILIEAKFILAEAAFNRLAKLETENPRWTEDINVRPERERLYHESLDLYLYPYLFFGSETEAASRGLAGALAVHRFNDDTPAAIEISRDLVRIYPDTTFAREASEFLASLSEDQLQQDNEKDAQYEHADATPEDRE